MSEDTYTEVTEQSWFGRIKDAVVGIFFGLILIAGAVGLLFWNEGRTVKRYKSLKEGAGAVISIESNSIAPVNEGKLVHLSGLATTAEILQDPQFSVSSNALFLRRDVKMYQWEESSTQKKRKKIGGGEETVTTYNYNKVWSSSLINSSGFKKPGHHQNPGRMLFTSNTINARRVTLNAFTLSHSLVQKINAYQPLPVDNLSDMPVVGGKRTSRTQDGIYIGNNEDSPEIGDMMIRFEHVKPTMVSVVARQSGHSFTPYQTKAGGSIEELALGVETAEAMIQKAQSENTLFAWLLRLGGFVLMFIGFAMLFKPLSVLADILPFVGSIVGFGTGIIALLLSLILSITVIAIAWIFYRPLLGGALIALAIGLIIMSIRAGKGKTLPDVKPLPGDDKTPDKESGDAFDFDNDVSASSKKTSVEDPFLTDE